MAWLIVVTCLAVTAVLRHQAGRHRAERETEYERQELRPGAARPRWGVPEAWLFTLGGALFAGLGGLFFYATLTTEVARFASRPDILFLVGLFMSTLSATGIAMVAGGIRLLRENLFFRRSSTGLSRPTPEG